MGTQTPILAIVLIDITEVRIGVIAGIETTLEAIMAGTATGALIVDGEHVVGSLLRCAPLTFLYKPQQRANLLLWFMLLITKK